MTIRVAVPVILARMRVVVDQGIHWNPIDRMLLWALRDAPMTPSTLAAEMDLPRPIVNEMIWKLMRFGWIEMTADRTAFCATMAGDRALHWEGGLPSLVWPDQRTVRAVIEPTQGRAFPSSEVIVRHENDVRVLEKEHEVRWLSADGIALPSFEELGYAAQACLQNADEEFVRIISERSKADHRYIVVTVHGGECHGLPEHAPDLLFDAVRVAAAQRGSSTVPLQRQLAPPRPRRAVEGIAVDHADILLDGAVHREVLGEILRASRDRIILHSTFVDVKAFDGLRDDLRMAVRQGARVDILYGANKDDRTRQRNSAAARGIGDLVAADPVLRQGVRMHMVSTQSHAKLVVADTGKPGSYVAIVGSCNWLSTPYKRVETSVVLRDGRMIAHLLRVIGEMSFAVARSSRLVGDLHDIAKVAERQVGPVGEASVRLVMGDDHGELMRLARDDARSSIWVGADRFGQAAEVKTLIPMMTAGKSGTKGRVMFSRCVTPVSAEDLNDLAFLAQESGVELSEVDEGVLHGKYLIWDDDNVVITSLNWSSAGTRRDNPWGEIGVHIEKPGVGAKLRQRIEVSLEVAKVSHLAEQKSHSDRKVRRK